MRIFELSPIGGGGESYLFGELFAEVLIGLIPHLAIDFRKRDVGAFNELFGFADAQVVDVGIYRHTELFRKESVEVIESDARRLGDFVAADLAVEIGRDEIGGGAQVLDPAADGIIRLRVILSDFGVSHPNFPSVYIPDAVLLPSMISADLEPNGNTPVAAKPIQQIRTGKKKAANRL